MALRALLGPTNTGKTHVALDDLCGVVDDGGTGVIGFPLRLLAREAYDRLCLRLGKHKVALLTGEEKIIPSMAQAFACTVESMPREQPSGRPFDFVGVDEIQLCADRERGHVFTDRLLHLRGTSSTVVLGADTIAPILRRLYQDDIEIQSRPRLSTLSHVGQKKLSRLPRRSAIVCFSVKDVYALAEEVRHHHGGAAVVTGALSPATRNAQVKLFQDGEVDVIVATDAIGMGLNLDIDHVAFAALRKFDGDDVRELTETEVAQIAGRAGRHLKDGTFGTLSSSSLGSVRAFDGDVVQRLERHQFQPLSGLSWRNSDLDYRSLAHLHESLRAPPEAVAGGRLDDDRVRGLFHFGRPASDLLALERLMHDPRVTSTARSTAQVEAFFGCCGIPDFEKISPDDHSSTILEVWQMIHAHGVVDDTWMARRLKLINDISGDVETLVARLARVRTLTFIAHKAGWTRDDRWEHETRAVEDRLSDALHDGLRARFVDRLARVVVRGDVAAVVDEAGGVSVGGESIGRLDGLRVSSTSDHLQQGAAAALNKHLEAALSSRVDAVLDGKDEEFAIDAATLRLQFQGQAVGRLVKGRTRLWPTVRALANDVDAAVRARLDEKLTAAARACIKRALPRVAALDDAVRGDAIEQRARAFAFALVDGLGVCARADVERDGPVDDDGRRALRRHRVRLGFKDAYVDDAFKDRAIQMRAALVALWHEPDGAPPTPPPSGASSFPVGGRPRGYLAACGFHVFDCEEVVEEDERERVVVVARAFRADLVDDVAVALKGFTPPFSSPAVACEKLGCSHPALRPVLHFLGYRSDENGNYLRGRPRGERQQRAVRP